MGQVKLPEKEGGKKKKGKDKTILRRLLIAEKKKTKYPIHVNGVSTKNVEKKKENGVAQRPEHATGY